MTVRTRIAPSPTGDPHVGTAYIALFNLCFARQHGGEFILRIEDTDQVRSTDASEQQIMQALKWLGLDWSEGPDVGGEFGPYRQSERSEIYHQHAQQLVEQGNAFPCFCTSERLNELRKTQMANKQKPGYDGCCANLPAAETASRIAGGESHVIRMRIPTEGVCTFKDMLRGDIEIEWSQVDMQVLMKADGLPTYHLANVVDDHLMQISHVIRGEEWINSAPKHQLLYQYFDWQMPELCHMPLLRNPDKSKLSKRKNPTSIMFYERMGFLPEALLNYLGRMGWSMPEEQEKFTLDDMVAHFDINRVSLGGPIFDMEKLRWLNGAWIREDLTLEQFSQRIQTWALNSNYLMQIAPHVKERVDTFSDLAPLAGFFLSGMPQLDEDSFAHKKVDNEAVRRVLQYSQWLLDVQQDWSVDELTAELTELAQKMELKIRDFLFPLFVAIAGNAVSTSVLVSMSILGADMSRARLRSALKVAGGVSKKETKRWQKEYAALSVNKSDADA